jgi:hypothetical protein
VGAPRILTERPKSSARSLGSEDAVIRALQHLRDFSDPRTGSILHVASTGERRREAFHPGLVAGLEERAALARALKQIAPRERLLLFMWYVEERPVTEIAAQLGISRVHCYRLRNGALARMTRSGTARAAASERLVTLP